jgi:hypothetical protein
MATVLLVCLSSLSLGVSVASANTGGSPDVECTTQLEVPGLGYRLVGLSYDRCGILESDAMGNVVGAHGLQAGEGPPPQPLAAPITGIVGSGASYASLGYWLVGADGGVFAFGDLGFFGSAAPIHLNAPIVGIAATYDNMGYYLVAADGGVFCFGDAHYEGSMAGRWLNAPIVGMAVDPLSGGYRLVGADGGVFAFDAPFLGSEAGVELNGPIVGIATDPAGGGYWLAASDGGIFSFGSPFFGSWVGNPGGYGSGPIVGIIGSVNDYVLGDQGGVWTDCAAPGSRGPDVPEGCVPAF